MALFGNLRGLFVCSLYEHRIYSIPAVGLLLVVSDSVYWKFQLSNETTCRVLGNRYIITLRYNQGKVVQVSR